MRRTSENVHLLVRDGDGMHPEICAATLEVLRAADCRLSMGLDYKSALKGFAALKEKGITFPREVLEAAREADGVVLGVPADPRSATIAEWGDGCVRSAPVWRAAARVVERP